MFKSTLEASDEFHVTHADAQLAGRQGFLAGAEWMLKQFKLHGTDGCRSCETGRATMYVTLDGLCLHCAQSSPTGQKL